jgi:hypothetical protein
MNAPLPQNADAQLLVEARLYATRIFRAHDRRVRLLIDGEWDHHPLIADYLADPDRLRAYLPVQS